MYVVRIPESARSSRRRCRWLISLSNRDMYETKPNKVRSLKGLTVLLKQIIMRMVRCSVKTISCWDTCFPSNSLKQNIYLVSLNCRWIEERNITYHLRHLYLILRRLRPLLSRAGNSPQTIYHWMILKSAPAAFPHHLVTKIAEDRLS